MTIRLLIVLIFSTFGFAHAQPSPDSAAIRRNVVKSTPLFALGHISLFYERVVSERVSWVGGFGYGWEDYRYENNAAKVPSPGQFRYERITLERRRYFARRHRAPLYTYWGLYGRLARLTLKDYTFDSKGQFIRDAAGELIKEKRTIYVLAPGAMGGVQLILGRVVVDTSLGLQLQLPSSNVPFKAVVAEALSSRGLIPRLGFSIGYLF